MSMGQSGGRSRGNRDGENARRRATQRERDGIDPPGHSEWDRVKTREDEEKQSLLETAVVVLSLALALALLVIIVGAWFYG